MTFKRNIFFLDVMEFREVKKCPQKPVVKAKPVIAVKAEIRSPQPVIKTQILPQPQPKPVETKKYHSKPVLIENLEKYAREYLENGEIERQHGVSFFFFGKML